MELIKAAVSAVDPSKTQKLGGLHRGMQIRELGMDSVATMEMVAYLEDKLETQFADEVMIRIETFGDLVDLIDTTRRG